MVTSHTLTGPTNQRAPRVGAPGRVRSLLALAAAFLALLALVACGGDEEAAPDAPTASTVPDAPVSDPPVATPVAEAQHDASRLSLDAYILAVCGDGFTEVAEWEEGESLRDLSSGLEFVTEQMGAIAPPVEVAEWHDAQLAFASAFKESVDDFLDDPDGRTEDEFLFSMFITLLPQFEPVEDAIAGMDSDVRARMAEAGCIESEASDSDPVMAAPDRRVVPVGGSVTGDLADPDRTAFLEFQAEMGQTYVVEVAWEGFPEMYGLIKDPPDPFVTHITMFDAETSPIVHRWTAPESGTFHLELTALEGAGSFNVSVSLDPNPASP